MRGLSGDRRVMASDTCARPSYLGNVSANVSANVNANVILDFSIALRGEKSN